MATGVQRKTVLITGAGGPAAIAFMRSIYHLPLDIVTVDADFRAAGLYLVPADRRALVPDASDPSFARELLALCRRFGVELVVPTRSTELLPLAAARDAFTNAGVDLLLAPHGALEVALDGLALMRAATDCIPTARFARLDMGFDADEWNFPFVAKLRDRSDEAADPRLQLIECAEQLAALPRDGSYYVQPFLPGRAQSVDCFTSRDARVTYACPRTRLEHAGGATTASVTERDRRLETRARRLLRRLGIDGLASVQFKRDAAGQPQLTGIHPRVPGAVSLTVAAGHNLPAMAVCDAIGWPLPNPEPAPRPLAMVRSWQETYLDPGDLLGPVARRRRASGGAS